MYISYAMKKRVVFNKKLYCENERKEKIHWSKWKAAVIHKEEKEERAQRVLKFGVMFELAEYKQCEL